MHMSQQEEFDARLESMTSEARDFISENNDPVGRAYLVYDGGLVKHPDGSDDPDVIIPSVSKEPSPHQMHGSPGERLCEFAARECYDSLGETPDKSRGSADYHAHMLQIGHYSVYGHYNWVVYLQFGDLQDYLAGIIAVSNRPGVRMVFDSTDLSIRVRVNIRAVLDWDKWTIMEQGVGAHPSNVMPGDDDSHDLVHRSSHPAGRGEAVAKDIRKAVYHTAVNKAPMLFKEIPEYPLASLITWGQVAPVYPHEHWISIYMVGSRGVSHEQVRHGFETAISQRSTRYCDEDETPWFVHPAIEHYLASEDSKSVEGVDLVGTMKQAIEAGRKAYQDIVKAVTPFLAKRLKGEKYAKSTARKQARGAARGFLGNGLKTSLLLSASIEQWGWMATMRYADAADAEICRLYDDVLPCLLKSVHAPFFMAIETEARKDGLGRCLTGGGHK